MKGGSRIKNTTKKDQKGGKKIERKKTIVTTAKAKKQHQQNDEPPHRPSKRAYRKDLSKLPNANRQSKYVGVSWKKHAKKWKTEIRIDGKIKFLGYYHDEKEAARMYDEQAALLGKPVNFPLHEGMEQAVKPNKNLSKMPNMNRPSKYVGVTWNREKKKWIASITMDGKHKSLGLYGDEKEAARMYDEQAIIFGKPVNFPLHEGMEQAVKYRKDRSKMPNVNRPSKYVGVSWHKQMKKWQAQIRIDGKLKTLSYYSYHDEKEAARMYDEQAALLGKPVNFPLHEGMEQAVKGPPKGI